MKAVLLPLMLAAAPAAAAELTVYAPDYFASEWGPGPAIEKGFEAQCNCDLKFVTGDVLPRLQLEGARATADVVLGLNTDETARARALDLFAPHGQDVADLTMPVAWADDIFLPFDWSELAFVYDSTRLATPPESFAQLLESDVKIVIQDPRSSTLGLSLILWVNAIYGDDAPEVWEKLAPKVLTVTKGWSEAYGMFTDGEADMVLSFITSPAYHIIAEKDETKKAAIFPEGHYFYVETAAKMKNAPNPDLAAEFMEYILSEEFQAMIPEGNWSFPAKLPTDKLPEGFRALPVPEKTLFYSEAEAEALRQPALEQWLKAFVR
ncbi:MAG: thiamine ABC transporter substrate binding subunit [Tepidimonas taiwanensis]|nr:thiamine ABC transporter substrate binding subunit [Tepidimonas taiwanensis]